MHHIHPKINGVKTRHWFYENWEETPLTSFINWQTLVPEMEALELKINEQNKIIVQWAKKYEELYFKGHKKVANKYLAKIKKRQKKIDEFNEELHAIEVQALSNFTSIPLQNLLSMKRKTRHKEETNDNYIDRHKARLVHLAAQKLPTDGSGSFFFQSKTDDEIQALKEEFEATPIYKFKRRNQIKTQIKKAQKTEYKITDIWEQTTTLNKEFQETANDIVEEMKAGNFQSLPYLICLLTAEDNEGSEQLNEIRSDNVKSYLENYRKELKEVIQRRMTIFFEQSIQLDVATAIRIKNFFLSNLTRSSKHTAKS